MCNTFYKYKGKRLLYIFGIPNDDDNSLCKLQFSHIQSSLNVGISKLFQRYEMTQFSLKKFLIRPKSN